MKTSYPKQKRLNPETELQIQVANYCLWNNIPMWHFANERKCSIQYGMQLKRMGVRPGVSDCYFPRALYYSSAWLELKSGKNKPTALQIEFMEEMRSYGHFADWANTYESAIAMIDMLHKNIM